MLCSFAGDGAADHCHADAIRDEKLKVLRSLEAWTPQSLGQHVVRGQYTAGSVGGETVPGYRDEAGVDARSTTETFVALRVEIANWRWAGVPFYIRTGKRLAAPDARIVINFRPAPHAIFNSPADGANRLVIKLQPTDGLELHLLAQGQEKRDRPRSAVQSLTPVHLDLDFEKRFGSERVGAYERLLLDVIDGRLNLSCEATSRRRLGAGRTDRGTPGTARARSRGLTQRWGPSAASAMIARDGYCWSEEC
jgi:glucose-6-phosphate 1-dehydrogenase